MNRRTLDRITLKEAEQVLEQEAKRRRGGRGR